MPNPVAYRCQMVVLVVVAIMGHVLNAVSLADDKAGNKASEKQSDKTKDVAKNAAKVEKPRTPVVTISPEREAAAILFARENHPELAALLDGLKRNAPREYQAALADLDRTVERIGKLKEKSPDRYQVEIADWKISSRIRLLAARLAMSEDPTVEAELRAALRERLELRLGAQRAERDRLQSRVTRLDQQIEDMTSRADATIEKQLTDLRKTLPAARTPVKPKSKRPAADATGVKGDKT
ncbi:MAG: hypothetical protein U0941_26125 [Planctomycetaceae bacterium]